MSELAKLDKYRKVYSSRLEDCEINDYLFTIEQMKKYVSEYSQENNLINTIKAMEVMELYHKGTVRKGPDHTAYIVHPLTLASHAISLGIADDIILPVCLLHDVIEDTEAKESDLMMSDNIVEAVRLLSFDEGIAPTKEEAKEIYYTRIADNKYASIVKVLDRCNNISNMSKAFSIKKMNSYVKETRRYVLPLLEILYDENEDMRDVIFILKYHMLSLLESIESILLF